MATLHWKFYYCEPDTEGEKQIEKSNVQIRNQIKNNYNNHSKSSKCRTFFLFFSLSKVNKSKKSTTQFLSRWNNISDICARKIWLKHNDLKIITIFIKIFTNWIVLNGPHLSWTFSTVMQNFNSQRIQYGYGRVSKWRKSKYHCRFICNGKSF